MRDLLDIDMVANWVSMLRADVDGAIVLVDSDSEGQFYEKCTHQAARVVSSPNAALRLLQQVQARHIAGVVAAVTGPVHKQGHPDSVFQPALGDVASILLASASCERVMEEAGGAVWLRACAREIGSLVDRAVLLAWSMRNYSESSLLKDQTFDPADTADSVDWSTLSVKPDVASAGLRTSLYREGDPIDRRALLAECDGMLAVEILAQCTQKFQPRGLRSKQPCSAAELLSMMRLSFDPEELEKDTLFWRMRAWERINAHYPLLRQWRLLDPLQVVLDQRYWERDLLAMLETAQGSGGTVALKLDLDNFKQVNEKLGHSAGDAAIRLACTVAKEVFGCVGEVYRRGGDEIVAIAPGLGEAAAADLAERLRTLLAERFEHWGGERGLEPTPTASIGLVYAAFGTKGAAVTALLDEAQSRAKQEGKNRVIYRSCPKNEDSSPAAAP